MLPVSRSLFYGPAAIVGDTMVVKGTTVEAFSSLIRFIYDDPGYISPTDGRQKLVEFHDLAEKYEVTRLVEEVKEVLLKLPTKVEIGSENKSEFDNVIKVENISEDLVDYEMNMNVVRRPASSALARHRQTP